MLVSLGSLISRTNIYFFEYKAEPVKSPPPGWSGLFGGQIRAKIIYTKKVVAV